MSNRNFANALVEAVDLAADTNHLVYISAPVGETENYLVSDEYNPDWIWKIYSGGRCAVNYTRLDEYMDLVREEE